uniref:EF-hand domain-containing protein n=1 Tax=Romanomermis culicivorax TaxID=13658 RepID=A0A915HQV0_ROMCU
MQNGARRAVKNKGQKLQSISENLILINGSVTKISHHRKSRKDLDDEMSVDQEASSELMATNCITDLDTNDEDKLDFQETVMFLEKMELLIRSSKNPFISSLCSKNLSSTESNNAQSLISELNNMILKDNQPTFFAFPAPTHDDAVVDIVSNGAALFHESTHIAYKVSASKCWRQDFAYRTSYPRFLMRMRSHLGVGHMGIAHLRISYLGIAHLEAAYLIKDYRQMKKSAFAKNLIFHHYLVNQGSSNSPGKVTGLLQDT